jgi:predicted AAA+ superfamily ATPase
MHSEDVPNLKSLTVAVQTEEFVFSHIIKYHGIMILRHFNKLISKRISDNKVIIILGPRQAGETTPD